MRSCSYCEGAAEGVTLMLRNPARFAIVGGIGELFIMFGRLFIMGATTLLCYLIITNAPNYTSTLSSPNIPTMMFAIISFVVGSIFMGIYGTAADTILVCFVMDEEMDP